MKFFVSFLWFLFCTIGAQSQDIFEKDYTKPQSTEIWTPIPKIVKAGTGALPPSDALVLFDGKDLNNWEMSKDGQPCKWKLDKGIMISKIGSGNIKTRKKFGDCQLHIEFMLPLDVKKYSHGNAGNSGVFMQERYEIQIFDSYNHETHTYVNGQCGSVYKQSIPMVTADNKPGEWNTYDIFYTAPKFRYNGTVEVPAYITLVYNGILILNHFEIQGSTEYIGIPRYELHGDGSIELQEHGSEVSFRNIWIRNL